MKRDKKKMKKNRMNIVKIFHYKSFHFGFFFLFFFLFRRRFACTFRLSFSSLCCFNILILFVNFFFFLLHSVLSLQLCAGALIFLFSSTSFAVYYLRILWLIESFLFCFHLFSTSFLIALNHM